MTVSTLTTPTATNTTPATSTSTSTPATDQQTLAGNFSTFLTLLTSQLQNQDPLSPMDSTQFTQQLVEFSQVEQQIKTNDNLTSLSQKFQAASAGAALSYLGKDALIQSDTTALQNGQASWGYSLPNAAGTVTLQVRDASNRDIFDATGETAAGNHVFTWNGQDNNGNTMPSGVYHLAVTAADTGGASITPTMTVQEVISGVDFSGTTPKVATASGSYDVSTIQAILAN